MSAIRGEEAVAHVKAGGVLDCAKCKGRQEADEITATYEALDDPACPECGCKGFIPLRAASKIEDRYPDGIGAWSPVPNALFTHGHHLGLTPADKLVIIALERYRWERGAWVYPSRETLADDTGLGTATIGRSIAGLVGYGYIERETQRTRFGHKRAYFNLEPLWLELERYSPSCDHHDHRQPPTTMIASLRSPRSGPAITMIEEEEVVEEEVEEEEPPAQASPARTFLDDVAEEERLKAVA